MQKYVQKRILKKLSKMINYQKVKDHCQYTGEFRSTTHSIFSLRFNVPNEFPVVFQNSSNYNYHFIISGLANESQERFECLGKHGKHRELRNILRLKKKSQE